MTLTYAQLSELDTRKLRDVATAWGKVRQRMDTAATDMTDGPWRTFRIGSWDGLAAGEAETFLLNLKANIEAGEHESATLATIIDDAAAAFDGLKSALNAVLAEIGSDPSLSITPDGRLQATPVAELRRLLPELSAGQHGAMFEAGTARAAGFEEKNATPAHYAAAAETLDGLVATTLSRACGEDSTFNASASAEVAIDIPDAPDLSQDRKDERDDSDERFGSRKHDWYDPRRALDETRQAATEAAVSLGGELADLPHASTMWQHYIEGSGDTFHIDPDELFADFRHREVEDGPTLDEAEAAQREAAALRALEGSANVGVPVAFESGWNGYDTNTRFERGSDQYDWSVAVGKFDYATTGTVTAQPPDADGLVTVEMKYQTHVYDRYDFNPKGDTRLPVDPEDYGDFRGLHDTGEAREYDVRGSTETKTATYVYDPARGTLTPA